jgi:hypothetical protein
MSEASQVKGQLVLFWASLIAVTVIYLNFCFQRTKFTFLKLIGDTQIQSGEGEK